VAEEGRQALREGASALGPSHGPRARPDARWARSCHPV